MSEYETQSTDQASIEIWFDNAGIGQAVQQL
jgi:hypothetical protein